jgi:flagellar motor protein MotB
MAYLVKAPRVGRSQGAVIFWGLVSAVFASAFCYYYLENRNNEEKNRTLLDQVMILQGERDSLDSERDKLEAAASNTEKQLAEREEFLQEKETNLAAEESQIDAAGSQTQSQSQLSQQQAAGVKRFDDAVRQIVAGSANADVVVRGGRPVLRLPSSIFFANGAARLSPAGKADLDQVAEAVRTPPGRFELRVEAFTDGAGEAPDAAPPAAVNPAVPNAGAAGHPAAPAALDAWTLTAQRAAAMAHYLRDRGTLPFQDVIVMGRADAPDIGPAPDGSSRSRRIEITLAPVAASFRAPEAKSPRTKPAASPAAQKPTGAGNSPTGRGAP